MIPELEKIAGVELRKADGFKQDLWPFDFEFISDELKNLCDASTITTYGISAFIGNYEPKDSSTDFVQMGTIASLVDSHTIATIFKGYHTKLQHPVSEKFRNKKLTLVFRTIWSSGSRFPVFFYPLVIK